MNNKLINATLLLSSICFASFAYANEVQLLTNKPMQISFKIARENPGGNPVFEPLQSLRVEKMANINIDRNGYAFVGIVPVNVDGHVIPGDANQFNQKNQCSMTTDSKVMSGALEFAVNNNKGNCKTHGGIFG